MFLCRSQAPTLRCLSPAPAVQACQGSALPPHLPLGFPILFLSRRFGKENKRPSWDGARGTLPASG